MWRSDLPTSTCAIQPTWAFVATWIRPSTIATASDEGAALPETREDVRSIGNLGDLPLIVLTATGPHWWPTMPAQVDEVQLNQEWQALQRKLATLSTRSTQLLADKSSHYMQFDQPEIIVEGIQRVIEQIQRSESKP